MAFIQIIELTTTRYDEIDALEQEWQAATEGKRTATRSTVCRDKADPTRHVIMVEFPSYEDAVRNSKLPETAAFAEKMQALCDGPPTFTDLEVVDQKQL